MVTSPPDQWDRRTDVAVIGSGTGLAAALAADEADADVLVLEKSPSIGGTTAVSGGGSWVPNSRPVVDAIGETPRADLLTYLRRITGGRTPDAKLERYVDEAPDVYRRIEEETALTFVHAKGPPDYHAEFEGGHPAGRMIVPDIYDGTRLGEHLDDVRMSPHLPPVTYREIEEAGGSAVFPTRLDYGTIGRRMGEDELGAGVALIAGLYEELLDRGVAFELDAPATDLVVDDGRVVGVVADIDGAATAVGAGAVVIAAGGIEWDRELCEQFLRGPLTAPTSPPYNEGDGIEMGAAAGAKLGNMNEAFWYPAVGIPGESWEDGSQLYRPTNGRYLPGAIIVNEDGERFANESVNYNDLGKTFHEFDPQAFEYANLPAYQIMDRGFRDQYAIAGMVLPEEGLQDWIETADTLEELASALDIDAAGLERTVETFNEHARDGEDPQFDRGGTPYERGLGDPDADHPNLGPLDQPPFYAFELHPGAVGTKGGLVTTVDSEVVDYDETPIPGLYASSNSAAHLMGLGYAGGGATIGPNVVFGYVAGDNAARAAREQ